jgi:large subunit ribosomal protein L9
MQVLLKSKIDNLGNRGEIVTVKDGYARNFLIPRGFAIAVNQDDLKSIEGEQRRLQKLADREHMETTALAEKISRAALVIVSKANEEGHLFGSVGPKEISDALTREVAPVEESAVRLETHLKSLGDYEVPIRLSGDVSVVVKVTVVGE